VVSEWAWAYLTYNQGARLITEPMEPASEPAAKTKVG
jgi:hypothetical protein